MQAGKLNRRVTIQQLTAGQDDIGEPIQVWADVATIWADVRYLSGLETVKSGAPVSVAKASLRARRRTDIAANMRGLENMKTAMIMGITKASPAVVTAVGHGFASGQRVRIDDVVGMPQVNTVLFRIERLTADTFSLVGVDSTAYGTYTSGGKAVLMTVFDIKAVMPDEQRREYLDLACETGGNEG